MDREIEQMVFTAAVFRNTTVAEIARSIGMSHQNLYRKIKSNTLKPAELSRIAESLGAEYMFYFLFPNGSKVGKLGIKSGIKNAGKNKKKLPRVRTA